MSSDLNNYAVAWIWTLALKSNAPASRHRNWKLPIHSRYHLEWISFQLFLLNDVVFLSCGEHVRNIQENLGFDSQPSPLNVVGQLSPLSRYKICFLHWTFVEFSREKWSSESAKNFNNNFLRKWCLISILFTFLSGTRMLISADF